MQDDDLDRILLGAIGSEASALADALNRSRLSPGQRISHYRIVEAIGEGGMGIVYKAEDEKLQRLVALKVLQPAPSMDRQLSARLEHEARAASTLNHPSICTVHDFDEQDGHRFIVMEYLTGQTLKERAATGVNEVDAIRIGVAVASALKAAHERRIVHCDIKPANIFLTDRGEVKVLDFGIATLQSREYRAGHSSSSSAAGTRAYMAPEQARGELVDERTDVFALGAVLREIVKTPSAGLKHLIARMTQADPAKRFQGMKEVRAALIDVQTRRNRRPWLVTAAVALIAAGAWGWVQPRPTALAERDWILIGEFENRTTDPAFSDVLGDVVSVQIGQSPYLIVFPDTRIAEQLELMRRPAEQPLTVEIAREMCERAGIKAFVTGSIAALGSNYVVRLDVINAQTGDYLAREEGTAADATGVLREISRASTAVRRALGESYQSVQRFDVPADTATTASLDALRAFRLGQEQMRLGTSAAMKAVPFFKRAIELDPEFSIAYARLSVAYANARESTRSEDAAREAFVRRGRVSERERYEIETRYYDNVSGEVSKAVEAVEMWAKAYPADPRPFNTLSAYFKNVGELERAAETGERALELQPASAIYRSNLAGAYFRLSQFARAADISQAAIRDGLDNSTTHRFLYSIAVITGNAALAASEAAWRATRTSDYAHLEYQASMAGAGGRISDARRLYGQAITLAEQQGLADRATEYRMRWALLELLAGNEREASRLTAPVVKGETSRLAKADAAFVLAAAGEPAHAPLIAGLRAAHPDDEYLERLWQPLIAAAADLRGGKPAPAIDTLRLLDRYDRGDHAGLRPSYYAGLAHLQLDGAAEAAKSFQRIIDNRGVVATSPLYALAHLGLARAAARGTDPAAARAAYDRFFELWKGADPGVPVLTSARAEYARLTETASP